MEDKNLTSPYELQEDEASGTPLIDLLTWVGEGKKFIAITAAVVGAGALAVALLLPDEYTARTTLLPAGSQQQSSSSAALAALGTLGGLTGSISPKTPDDLYVRLLQSDSVLRPIATRFSLQKRYGVESFEMLRRTVIKHVRVSSDKKAGLITVEVDDEDPKFAAALANAHAEEVSKLLSRLAVSEAQQRRVFFEVQLKEAKENLIEAEQALRQVQEKSGVVVLDQQAGAIFKGIAELKGRIVEREVRLKVLRTATTAQNPDVMLLTAELGALRGELARMESSSGSAERSKGSVDIPVSKLPAASVDYVRALREVKFQESMLGSMLRQFEIAKLDEAKDSPALQQVDVAQPPDRKAKPARGLIVVAATFAALLLSALFVALRRYLQVSREEDPDGAHAWASLRQAWKLRGG
jgi:uncharacterized protein involved in exopolysaccharide biosynthesis